MINKVYATSSRQTTWLDNPHTSLFTKSNYKSNEKKLLSLSVSYTYKHTHTLKMSQVCRQYKCFRNNIKMF